MAKPDLGTKRTCTNCGTRFYDLHRDPMVCPKCGQSHTADSFLKTKRSRPAAVAEPPKPKKAAVAATGDDFEIEKGLDIEDDADEDGDVLEDADELGDEDDVADVVGVDEEDD